MGWPIVGDNIYGTQASLRRLRKESSPRTGGPVLHLHSREVVVPLYKNRDAIRVSAPVPEHMRSRLAACGWKQESIAAS
jgi:tRNA pseudouridine32 synthase/23S rRNA pseudouridine746 synthase